MSASTDNEFRFGSGSSISRLLCAVKKELQDVALGRRASTGLNQNEVDVLEQGAFEVLRLIRSLKNGHVPINRIPPEVLTLIPDSWDKRCRDKDVIALTHVCRAWRGIFISRSSLWTELKCADMDKTRVYLERSKTSPIDLQVRRRGLSPDDPFLEIDPRAISRLKSLNLDGTPEIFEDTTARLSHPAPLLETLTILVESLYTTRRYPAVTTELFDGDLSSLRELNLYRVRTELPWRNMVNLTSFKLYWTPPGEVSITQLLNFFESAPHLREVRLHSVSLASGDQDERLVPLSCLKELSIRGDQPTTLLFDHLLIPVGADLKTHLRLPLPRIKDHLPRSLDNLRNLSNFTELYLLLGGFYTHVEFNGPNGKFLTFSESPGVYTTAPVLEYLAQFDTSTAEKLEIVRSDPFSEDLPYQALLPMKNLYTLTISRCKNLHSYIRALDPNINPSNFLICPKLEELVLRIDRKDVFDVGSVVEMAAARASRGAKLKSVMVVGLGYLVSVDVLELGEHVSRVECGFADVEDDYSSDVYGSDEDSDDSSEED